MQCYYSPDAERRIYSRAFRHDVVHSVVCLHLPFRLVHEELQSLVSDSIRSSGTNGDKWWRGEEAWTCEVLSTESTVESLAIGGSTRPASVGGIDGACRGPEKEDGEDGDAKTTHDKDEMKSLDQPGRSERRKDANYGTVSSFNTI